MFSKRFLAISKNLCTYFIKFQSVKYALYNRLVGKTKFIIETSLRNLFAYTNNVNDNNLNKHNCLMINKLDVYIYGSEHFVDVYSDERQKTRCRFMRRCLWIVNDEKCKIALSNRYKLFSVCRHRRRPLAVARVQRESHIVHQRLS